MLVLMDETCLPRQNIDCTPSVYVYTAFQFQTHSRNQFIYNAAEMENFSAETVLCSESYAGGKENSTDETAVSEAT
jgi:hypothetical protein